jgi:hypothetical protein
MARRKRRKWVFGDEKFLIYDFFSDILAFFSTEYVIVSKVTTMILTCIIKESFIRSMFYLNWTHPHNPGYVGPWNTTAFLIYTEQKYKLNMQQFQRFYRVTVHIRKTVNWNKSIRLQSKDFTWLGIQICICWSQMYIKISRGDTWIRKPVSIWCDHHAEQHISSELIRLLIVTCGMLSHSSSMAVRSCWILLWTGTRCHTRWSRASTSNQNLLVTYTWLADVNTSVAQCLCF